MKNKHTLQTLLQLRKTENSEFVGGGGAEEKEVLQELLQEKEEEEEFATEIKETLGPGDSTRKEKRSPHKAAQAAIHHLTQGRVTVERIGVRSPKRASKGASKRASKEASTKASKGTSKIRGAGKSSGAETEVHVQVGSAEEAKHLIALGTITIGDKRWEINPGGGGALPVRGAGDVLPATAEVSGGALGNGRRDESEEYEVAI